MLRLVQWYIRNKCQLEVTDKNAEYDKSESGTFLIEERKRSQTAIALYINESLFMPFYVHNEGNAPFKNETY